VNGWPTFLAPAKSVDFHPGDEDLSLGTPDFHPGDEDLSLGTPDFHPGDEDLSLGTPDLRVPAPGTATREWP
jgi:hypothetical protein